jgi:purine-binding chemotaxis protein CheW
VLDDATRLILEKRARELARPMEEEERGEITSLLVLGVRAELYGIDITLVQETRPFTEMAPLPNVPPFWKGLVNVRGRLCPVLDLGRYLQVPDEVPDGGDGTKAAESDREMLVVIGGAPVTVALLVDSVGQITRIPSGSIKSSAAEALAGASRVILGVTPDLISVLDAAALLGDDALAVQGA